MSRPTLTMSVERSVAIFQFEKSAVVRFAAAIGALKDDRG